MKLFLILTLILSSQAWAKWSISTYNIRNFDNDRTAGKTNLVELEKIIKSVQSEVMVFEEIVNKAAFEAIVTKALPGYSMNLSKCGGFGKQHLAVVYNPKIFQFVEMSEDMTFSGSTTGCGSLRPVFLVTLKNTASQQVYTFGAVHLKAGGDAKAFAKRWEQYKGLEKLSKKYAAKNLILLGDFNTTGYNIKDQDYTRFEELLSGSGMKTMTETLGCTNYWAGLLGGAEYQSSILDHIVLQDKNVAAVQNVKVGAHCAKLDCRPATPKDLGISYQSVSDHCPVQVTFK